MKFSIQDIANAIGAEAAGDTAISVTGTSEPADAGPDLLALAMRPEFAEKIAEGSARAAVLWRGADWEKFGLEAAILVERPRFAMSRLTHVFDPGPSIAPGIHPTAVVDPSARIGANAAIGPYVVVGPDVRIGENARIDAHVILGQGVEIGADALIHAGVRIGARVVIGDRFICQPGAAIGSDGFSFVTEQKSGVESARETMGDQGAAEAQPWLRINSLGAVVLGDDVEIGANCAIDRGTIRATRIGNGTKLDNLVHLGHNVVIGDNCLICGQVGIAGSTNVGNNVVLGGQVGVNDNIFVGDGVIASGGTKITSNAPAGRVLMGYPAMKMDTQVEIYKALRRLPRLFAQVAALQKTVQNPDQKD
ncbi:MAG: UDP-3-O-(3-hydroxymyristoyl)glucosamine N-acyltransferase [Rhodobacteraceae bacterium]|nr:UDP-3-O-(3-hydroxymyristoyl)glucosamine N-acyltransferase [Paracoccaceae bacterium]